MLFTNFNHLGNSSKFNVSRHLEMIGTVYLTKLYDYFTVKMNCDCGGGKYDRCGSSYPCLKIYIQYDKPNNNTVYAQLFESEFELRGNEVCLMVNKSFYF